MGSIYHLSPLFNCVLIRMLIRQVILQIVTLPLVTAFYLAPILSLVEVRNVLLLLALALKYNIVL